MPTEGIGPVPRDLPEGVKDAWREIVKDCPEGVLTSCDRIAVRSAARLLALENSGAIENAQRTQLHNILASFGMTPRGRAYVKTTTPEKKAGAFAEV